MDANSEEPIIKAKTFEFSLKGNTVELTEAEIHKLKKYFDKIYERYFDNSKDTVPDEIVEKIDLVGDSEDAEKLMLDLTDPNLFNKESNRKPTLTKFYVGPDWNMIGESTTRSKNGGSGTTFTYYKGKKHGTFAFVNEYTRKFHRMGTIDNHYSVVGKFVRRIKPGTRLTKSEAIRLRYAYNSDYAKALLEMLEQDGYFVKDDTIPNDTRKGTVYVRTEKIDGLGVVTNSGHVAQVNPNPQVRMGS